MADDSMYDLSSDILDEPADEQDQVKKGNYLLTFGKTSCGKTAFQQHLIRWLMEEEEEATTHLELAEEGWSSHVLLREWKESWSTGSFPPRTEINKKAKEFKLSVIPNAKSKPSLEFSFLEVAGEKFKKVMATNEKAPELPEELSKLLDSDDVRLCIVLVCDGTNPSGDDVLFCSFLDYLRIVYKGKYDTAPVLTIVSKWDEVLKRLTHKGDRAGGLDKFINRHLRGTTGKLKARRSGTVLCTEFSVGSVRKKEAAATNDSDIKTEIDHINTAKYDHVRDISRWIYKSYTGISITKKSRIRQLMRMLAGT